MHTAHTSHVRCFQPSASPQIPRWSTAMCAAQNSSSPLNGKGKPLSMREMRQLQQQPDMQQAPVGQDPEPASTPPQPQRQARARRLATASQPQQAYAGAQPLLDVDKPLSGAPGLQQGEQGIQTTVDAHPSEHHTPQQQLQPASRGQPYKQPAGGRVQLVAPSKRGRTEAAVETGLRMLSRRALSASELHQKLKLKGYEDAAANGALARLKELGEIDDARYAALYIRSKWRASQRGPQVLRMELKRKGVDDALVKNALATFFKDDLTASGWGAHDETEVEEPVLGFESQQRHLMLDLVAVAGRRLNAMSGLPKEKQIQRLSGWLSRRGHNWDTVKVVLKQLGLM